MYNPKKKKKILKASRTKVKQKKKNSRFVNSHSKALQWSLPGGCWKTKDSFNYYYFYCK